MHNTSQAFANALASAFHTARPTLPFTFHFSLSPSPSLSHSFSLNDCQRFLFYVINKFILSLSQTFRYCLTITSNANHNRIENIQQIVFKIQIFFIISLLALAFASSAITTAIPLLPSFALIFNFYSKNSYNLNAFSVQPLCWPKVLDLKPLHRFRPHMSHIDHKGRTIATIAMRLQTVKQ